MIAYLQRTVGNQAVNQLLASEDERLRVGLPPATTTDDSATAVGEVVHRKSAAPRIGRDGGPVPDDLAERIQSQSGSGAALDPDTSARMETAFGDSFSDVRIHADGEADALNQNVGAVAFTLGNDIFFRRGAYAPGAPDGRELLGHELTHVVQQRSMQSSGPLQVGPADDFFEHEADEHAATLSRVAADDSDVEDDETSIQRMTLQRMTLGQASHLQRSMDWIRRDADDDLDDAMDASADTSDSDSAASASQTSPDPSAQSQAPVEQSIPLSQPQPIPVNPDDVTGGPGDYPEPDPNVAMAKRDDGSFQIQRDDDDSPHLGGDVSAGGNVPLYTAPGAQAPAPWSLQVTGVYRDLNIAQLKSLHLDLGHEPSISLQADSSGAVSLQSGITLLNYHWMPIWNREVEVGLSGFINTTIVPQLANAYGGQVQVEQHIVPWFSVTLNASGQWTPPSGSQPGQFQATAGAGVLFHADF